MDTCATLTLIVPPHAHWQATQTWEMVNGFEAATKDACDLVWSPDDRVICVWDSPLEYKVVGYVLALPSTLSCLLCPALACLPPACLGSRMTCSVGRCNELQSTNSHELTLATLHPHARTHIHACVYA